MTGTEYTFQSLAAQFEVLAAGLEGRSATKEQRKSILKRMRSLIEIADKLTLCEELHLASERADAAD